MATDGNVVITLRVMLDSEHHMESDGYLRQCSHHTPCDGQAAIITRSVMAT